MDHNPYLPPKSPVEQVLPTDTGRRPIEVTRAIWFLGAFLVLTSLILVVSFMLFGLIPPGVLALLVWQTWKGSNWARVSMLAVVCVIAAVVIPTAYVGIRLAIVTLDWAQPETGILMLALGILQIAGVITGAVAMNLLFTRPGKEWFRQRPRER